MIAVLREQESCEEQDEDIDQRDDDF